MENFLKNYKKIKNKKEEIKENNNILNEIKNIDLLNTSGRDAFELLYNFKSRLKKYE